MVSSIGGLAARRLVVLLSVLVSFGLVSYGVADAWLGSRSPRPRTSARAPGANADTTRPAVSSPIA